METNIEKNVFRFRFLTSYTSNNLNLEYLSIFVERNTQEYLTGNVHLAY